MFVQLNDIGQITLQDARKIMCRIAAIHNLGKWLILFALLLTAIAGLRELSVPPKRAVIVDQLSVGFPNPGFRENATRLLQEAGYRVAYIPNEAVTVEFFRNLPARGDDLILLRVHSSARFVTHQGEVVDDVSVSLCTGDPLSKAYPRERNSAQLGGFETFGSDTLFFAVRGEFFKRSAAGRFRNSVIVLMGCEGLRIPTTAQIFLDMGAQAVVGWTDQISPRYMDEAALTFLYAWLKQQQPFSVAVETTEQRVGRDPAFPKAELTYISVNE